MVSEKYEVGYAGDCSYGHHLSESLGKQFPVLAPRTVWLACVSRLTFLVRVCL